MSGGADDAVSDATAAAEVTTAASAERPNSSPASRGGKRPGQHVFRHGLNTTLRVLRLRGFEGIDHRMGVYQAVSRFRSQLMKDLGGEAQLSTQQRKLIDLAARSSLLLDHVDAWLFEQESLITPVGAGAPTPPASKGEANGKAEDKKVPRETITVYQLMPVLHQRQGLAEHLAKLLDRLGLDRVTPRAMDLKQYAAEKYGSATSEGEAT